MKVTLFRLLVLTALLSGITQAAKDPNPKPTKRSVQPVAEGQVEVLKPYDKNDNGQIDSDELVAVQAAFAALRKLDKNANGEIELSEAATPKPGAERARVAKARDSFRKVDINGNRKIDTEEIEGLQRSLAGGRLMTRLDANKNGKLETSEVEVFNQRLGRMAGGKTKGQTPAPTFRKPPAPPTEQAAPPISEPPTTPTTPPKLPESLAK